MLSREQELIHSLYQEKAKEDSNTKTLAHLMHGVIHDTFAGEKYISELMQNADDAHSSSVKFILVGPYLIFQHNGKHFDEADVRGICDAADPSRAKVLDTEQIGNKGVGFKAVFSMAETVYIFSKHYQFRFDETYSLWKDKSYDYPWELIPIPTALEESPKALSEYIDPSKVNFIFTVREGVRASIVTHLQRLRSSAYLLFLRHIKNLSCMIDGDAWHNELHTETDIKLPTEEPLDFSLSKVDIDDDSYWLTYTKNCELPESLRVELATADDIPAKYKSFTKLPIKIAIFCQNNQLIPVTEEQKVYCYLPTDIDLSTNFLVNAEFLLDTSRMHIRKGGVAEKWNEFIKTSIYVEQVKLLNILASKLFEKGFWRSIFTILSPPPKIRNTFMSGFRYPSAFEEAIKDTTLVINHPKTNIVKIRKCYIDTHNFIKHFGSEAQQKYCVNADIENTQLMSELGAKKFDLDEIIESLKQADFQTKIADPELNKAFLHFMMKLSGATDSYSLKIALRDTPLLLSKDGKLHKPANIYFPEEKFASLSEGLEISILHPAIHNDPELTKFIASLGVQTLNIPQMVSVANKSTQLLDFTRKAIEIWNTLDNLVKYHFKSIKLFSKDNTLVDNKECYLSAIYEPKVPLEPLMNGSGFLLSDCYAGLAHSKQFLIDMEVSDNLSNANIRKIVEILNSENNPKALMEFTRLLFETEYFKATESRQKDILRQLSALKVVSETNKVMAAKECYLANVYEPDEPLQGFIATIEFVSTAYLGASRDEKVKNAWKTFFLALGVKSEIKLTPHYRATVSDLLKKDPATRPYLESINLRFYGDNWIESYLEIEFLKNIYSTPTFWKSLAKHWNLIADNLEDISFVRWTIPSNIKYWIERSVQEHYGEEPADLYCSEIASKLGAFAHSLPIADIASSLTSEQQTKLGFKPTLSKADCKKLLQAIAEADNWERDFDKITFIYQQLIKNDPIAVRRDTTNILLLNNVGQFVRTTQLHYIINNLLPHTKSEYLIKKPGSISEEDFEKICRMLSVNLIRFSDLSIGKESARKDSSLARKIIDRLHFIISAQADKNDWVGETREAEITKLSSHIKEKLASITCYLAKNYIISHGPINEEADLWIDLEHKIIYHVDIDDLEHAEQKALAGFLLNHFGLNIEEDDFITIMHSRIDKVRRKFTHAGVDVSARDETKSASLKSSSKSILKASVGDAYKTAAKPSASTTEPAVSKSAIPKMTVDATLDLPSLLRSTHLSSVSKSTTPPYASNASAAPFSAALSSRAELEAHAYLTSSAPVKKAINETTRPFISHLSREDRLSIGRAGEQAVFDYLKQKHSKKYGESNIIDTPQGYKILTRDGSKQVIWMNKDFESGAEYDFEIIVAKGALSKHRYIEVKATTSSDSVIEIHYSIREWEKMQTSTEPATSYRLYLVGLNDHMLNIYKPEQITAYPVVDYKKVVLPGFSPSLE